LSTHYFLIPIGWRQAAFCGRLIVAVAVVLAARSNWERALAIAYAVHAAVALLWRTLQRPMAGQALLVTDIAVLVGITIAFGVPSPLPLAYAWLLLVLTEALLLHHWVDVTAAGAAASAAFAAGASVIGDRLLVGSAVALTVLGVIAALVKAQIEGRLYKLSRMNVLHRAEAVTARDSERERLANDFHDGPLQAFVSLQMRLEVVRRMLAKSPEAGIKELEQLQSLWKNQIDEMRVFVRNIRQQELETVDLAVSLGRLTEAFTKESAVPVRLSGTADLESLEPRAATEILQILREALHNIHKHAGASEVAVRVQDKGGSPPMIELTVEDNGKGLEFEGTYSLEELDAMGRGPASIRRRVRNLGGSLKLESQVGRGTRLVIQVPR
jgi:two-component system NarL family sensor kinase